MTKEYLRTTQWTQGKENQSRRLKSSLGEVIQRLAIFFQSLDSHHVQ